MADLGTTASLGRRGGAGVETLAFAGVHLLVGTWLLVSPSLLAGPLAAGEDDLAVGVFVLLLGAYGLYRSVRGYRPRPNAYLLGTVAGLWLVAFSIEYGGSAFLANGSVVAGVAIAAVDLALHRRSDDPGPLQTES